MLYLNPCPKKSYTPPNSEGTSNGYCLKTSCVNLYCLSQALPIYFQESLCQTLKDYVLEGVWF